MKNVKTDVKLIFSRESLIRLKHILTVWGKFMFGFMQEKFFRKSFYLYMSIILVFTLVIGFLLTTRETGGYLDLFVEDSGNANLACQKNLKSVIGEIDGFYDKSNIDENLKQGFDQFYHLSQLTYDPQKITAPLRRLFEEINALEKASGGVLTQILYQSSNSANVISFDENGEYSLFWNVPLDELQQSLDTMQYFEVQKPLRDLDNASLEIGKISFILDRDAIFKAAEGYDLYHCYVVSSTGASDVLDQTSENIPQDILTAIMDAGKNIGSFSAGLLDQTHYTVHSSEIYDYSFITYINTFTLVAIHFASYIPIIILLLLLFFIASTCILFRLRYDYNSVNNIISLINDAKRGKLNTNLRHRGDQYGVIVAELNDMSARVNRYINKEYLLKLNQQKAEMVALQNQINPHFLYNTLEIIRSRALVNHDLELADAIARLGNMYRSIVKAENILTLREELEILENYLGLMQFKYPENFYYQIDIPESMTELTTVKFWMQTIVENFFKHGFHPENEFNLVLVIGTDTEDYYEIKFVDNGTRLPYDVLERLNESFSEEDQSVPQPQAKGMGMKNIYLRLYQMHEGKFRMWAENNEESGITIFLRRYK